MTAALTTAATALTATATDGGADLTAMAATAMRNADGSGGVDSVLARQFQAVVLDRRRHAMFVLGRRRRAVLARRPVAQRRRLHELGAVDGRKPTTRCSVQVSGMANTHSAPVLVLSYVLVWSYQNQTYLPSSCPPLRADFWYHKHSAPVLV